MGDAPNRECAGDLGRGIRSLPFFHKVPGPVVTGIHIDTTCVAVYACKQPIALCLNCEHRTAIYLAKLGLGRPFVFSHVTDRLYSDGDVECVSRFSKRF